MQRNIIKNRDLETGGKNFESYDIIRKKKKIKEILLKDPDIKEVLGMKEPRPLNQYKDPSHPLPEEVVEREEILTYNKNIKHEQIVPWIKLNGIQREVLNFIMYEIEDERISYINSKLKHQRITFWILVHENDMETEYGVPRTDLLGYLIKDNLNWSNALGSQLTCIEDGFRIVDNTYYCRMITFQTEEVNGIYGGNKNPHDRFRSDQESDRTTKGVSFQEE